MSRRSRSLSSTSSDDLSDYKDEGWRQEDNVWSTRTDRKYITFRWSSGCGTGRELYKGQVRDHSSSREGARRIDYLLILVDGEENSYKLGKDIRHFHLYADRKFTRLVAEWSRKGWVFHKEDIFEAKLPAPVALKDAQVTRNLLLTSNGIEISNSFSGGIASKLLSFHFYRSASEICGWSKDREVSSPTQARE